jgi:putative ABC transport system permease protein
MIAHLWKLVWNRKGASALMLTELLVAFLVLAALGTAGAYYLHNSRQPLGYKFEDVWVARVGHGISRREGMPQATIEEAMATTRHLLQTVRDMPEVVSVSAAMTGPYVQGSTTRWRTDGQDIPVRGRGVEFDVDKVTDGYKDVLGLTVVKGRWFGREDNGARYHPAVINERMAQEFFGDEDPIGRQVGTGDHQQPIRVVGVIAGYRQGGELAPPQPYMLRRFIPGHADELPYDHIYVKTRPGTSAAFEDALDKRLRATAIPDWSFNVRYLPDVRAGLRKVELMPLVVAAVIASFLMLMVVLGLTGVLWQNVTQRTQEIGLRRAKGATRTLIYAQILGELMIMTLMALIAGLVLLAHVPFLNLVDDMNAGIYLTGGGMAALVIVLITLLCGFYPARLAARVQPAVALRTE